MRFLEFEDPKLLDPMTQTYSLFPNYNKLFEIININHSKQCNLVMHNY